MKNLLLSTMILLFGSCALIKPGKSIIFWVNSYKVNCTGISPMKCILVQKGESIEQGQWKNFYSEIEGFEYETGYLYKLKVKEEKQENVPADASSIKYTLIKVVEKKKDLKLRINDIWVATSIGSEDIYFIGDNSVLKNVQIEIHIADMRITGNDGCNNFTGSITTFDDGFIEFGPIAGTRMMCADMTIPDKFNAALIKVKKYKIADMKLIFLDEEGKDLIALKKVD
jgi:heat shock protein HslJ